MSLGSFQVTDSEKNHTFHPQESEDDEEDDGGGDDERWSLVMKNTLMKEDKYLQEEAALRTVPSGPGPHPHQTAPPTRNQEPGLIHTRLKKTTLWKELASVPIKTFEITDPDMQSIIQSLQEALRIYDSDLKQKSILTPLATLPCTEAVYQLEQISDVARRLSHYPVCARQVMDNKDLCNVVKLNNDLLQHLEGSYQDSADCSSSSSSSPSSQVTDFDTLRESVQCFHCWIQQVEALRR
ncbi:uncharacterized protein LOC111646959 [Xyrichtys novacula]|uniref:Uncharacterized protein LOC111646959 n=1 Tax=Xyrichtys novacula TaxID=13765 RepID=A0AAV1FK53_XYRNO|nr:uncharacterized protein LOC111646959 [Xyrichtys novacula]